MSAPGSTIVLFGCGGHSRSVADIILLNDPGARLLFVDENARENERILGFDLLREPPAGNFPFFLAIGDNGKRKRKYEEADRDHLISVIARTAHLGRGATVQPGCFLANFCHVGPEAVIGADTIINTAAIVEHEVKIGSHCHIGPNAAISGRCVIGDLTFVGVGATIKDYVKVCAGVMIGAGATVVADITEPGTYVGTPARRIA